MELKIETEQDFKRACLRGAWRGLRSQGFERAMASGGNCVWRAPNGRRCAVGWLIPDTKLNPAMTTVHGTGGGAVWDRNLAEPLQRWATQHRAQATQVLTHLQCSHDQARTPAEMRRNLRRLAKAWGVELPEDGQ